MRIFKKIGMVFVLFAGLTSCGMVESTIDCVVNTQLRFHFSRDGEVLLGEEVPSLSVFVFDGEEKYVGRWDEMDSNKITSEYTMTLPLAPGEYSFVVWGGLSDDNYYLSSQGLGHGYVLQPVVGETLKEHFALRASRTSRNSYDAVRNYVDYVPGALFFGDTDLETLEPNQNRDIDVDLVKYTNTINLTVVGLPESGSTRAGQYTHMDVTLTSSNGGYDFSGQLAADRATLTYPQHNVADSEPLTQVSTIHTIRPVFGNDHQLSFYNTEAQGYFYSADILDDYIRKTQDDSGRYVYDTQEAVDEEDTFDITIDLRSPVNVVVTVNDYHVNTTGSTIQ